MTSTSPQRVAHQPREPRRSSEAAEPRAAERRLHARVGRLCVACPLPTRFSKQRHRPENASGATERVANPLLPQRLLHGRTIIALLINKYKVLCPGCASSREQHFTNPHRISSLRDQDLDNLYSIQNVGTYAGVPTFCHVPRLPSEGADPPS